MSYVSILKDKSLPRHCGKTAMLIMHYVQLVMDNPGRRVAVEDHSDYHEADRHLFVSVCQVLQIIGIPFKSDRSTMTLMNTGKDHLNLYPTVDQCLDAERREMYKLNRSVKYRGLRNTIL